TKFNGPPWRGEALGGKRILLHAEQGFGDTIQFVRYVPMVIGRGGKVVLCVQPELCRLLEKFPGVEKVAARLGDLPGTFDTRLETIPNQVGYIQADAELCEVWRRKLGETSGLRVGIAWAGRTTHANNLFRSMQLSMFGGLGSVAGMTFYSLQK